MLIIVLVIGYFVYGMFAYDNTYSRPVRELTELSQKAYGELLRNGATFDEAKLIISGEIDNLSGDNKLEDANEILKNIIENPTNYISN